MLIHAWPSLLSHVTSLELGAIGQTLVPSTTFQQSLSNIIGLPSLSTPWFFACIWMHLFAQKIVLSIEETFHLTPFRLQVRFTPQDKRHLIFSRRNIWQLHKAKDMIKCNVLWTQVQLCGWLCLELAKFIVLWWWENALLNKLLCLQVLCHFQISLYFLSFLVFPSLEAVYVL